MFRFSRNISFVLPLLVFPIFAGPKIKFDTKTFSCGTVIEGKTDKLNAVFLVTNTGDSLLRLQSVRPGCGCTVVKYDSLIQPGKTAKIESQVNIKASHSGQISKGITVTSNAINEPTVHLSIEATLKSIIDISETYLNLTSSNLTAPYTIYLTSKKPDLNVSDVSFKSNDGEQSNLALPIKFKFLPTDSVQTDSFRVFKLNVYPPTLKTSISGEFVIKTNHPEKPEISLRGVISK